MPATPEIPKPEISQVSERQEEFIVPETLQQSTGIQVVQKNFKAQVNDDHGQPLIQTPPSQVITVTPPADDVTLTDWSKGSTTSSLTWLAAFWIRIIKKAMFFGWKIIGKENVNAT
jgi:hypothetical protein